METLSKLFGSTAKVKILRLFLFNPDKTFLIDDVAKKTKVSLAETRRELSTLSAGHFLKEKKVVVKKGRSATKKSYALTEGYPFVEALRLLFNSDFFSNRRSIVNRFKKCGRIKLLVIAGAFIQRLDGPADLVIVGDELKRNLIDQVIRNLEAETGRELTYAVFDTSDFMYRYHSSDHFVRDLFEFEHERLVDKLNT